jgi:hypothetical protein
MDREVASLRRRKTFGVIARAFWRAQGRFGMRLVHFSVQSTHIHLIVEGVSSSAMNGLGTRIGRGLNRLLGRHGKVLGERYHARALRTPTEVRNAINYVLNNHHHHTGRAEADPYMSLAQPQIVVEPRTWLLVHAPPEWPRRAASAATRA